MTEITIENVVHKISPLAALVPMASKYDQEALTDDIQQRGLREPIVRWRGDVVDGRCRLAALKIVGGLPHFKELDDDLTEDEVATYVKSVNTRRNLTITQKAIVATKQTFDKKNKLNITDVAKSWAISKPLLDNARYIYKHRFEMIEPLFNGETVKIVNNHGVEVESSKVSTIFASIKKANENTTEVHDEDKAWGNGYEFHTQKAREYAFDEMKKFRSIVGQEHSKSSEIYAMYQRVLVDSANSKFTIDKQGY